MLDKKDINDLISDIEYLKFEAKSLHAVIESVPYSDKPLGGMSILERLLFLDTCQNKILKVLSKIETDGNNIDISDFGLFEKQELSEHEISESNIKENLKVFNTGRSELVDFLSDKSVAFFGVELKDGTDNISIFQLLTKFVKKERGVLKEIADLVLTYQSDRQFRREIAGRKKS